MRKQPFGNALLAVRRQINETTWRVTQTRHGGQGVSGMQQGGGREADCSREEAET